MKLPVACAINRDYALPLLVTLTSLAEHLRPSYRLFIYLIHPGLNEDVLAAISKLAEMHSFIPGAASTSAIPPHERFPAEAASVLLLPELLPEDLDRVLFLDADLLVLDDVAELWETPSEDTLLSAVPDWAIPFCGSPRGVKSRNELGIPDGAPYFNGGVMLIELAKWRKRKVAERALDYLRKVGRRADFLHQEALNAILWKDWRAIDRRWNLLGSVAGRRFDQPKSKSWRNPGIVHFAGRFKPWKARVGGFFDEPYGVFLSQVTQRVPAVKPTLKDKLLSLYDRQLRDSVYHFERALWTRRIL